MRWSGNTAAATALALLALAPAALLSGACVGKRDRAPAEGQPSDSPARPPNQPPASPDAAPAAPAPGPRVPARIRRLSNAELAATVAALLPGAPPLPLELAPDARQNQFSANAAQRVDPLYASQLQEAAQALATAAAPRLLVELGCSDGDPCAQGFIDRFVGRAWRRPLSASERTDLLDVFHAGASAAGFVGGVALVVEAALQSASFLYVTELGTTRAAQGLVHLAPHEVAVAMAYLVTGGPPDPALRASAEATGLDSPAARGAEARRLLATPGAQRQVQRFVSEWLGIDQLAITSKDSTAYPSFDAYQPLMLTETDAFIAEVVFRDEGTLARLLTADYTVAEDALARYYDLAPAPTPGGRNALGRGPRRGLLTQSSFLAVHAHADSSAPVKRGVAVLDRLLCLALPKPSDLQLSVLPPRPDPARTTRARFDVHSRDPSCAVCHALIDPVGFAFEGFDGVGQPRKTENDQPVVTSAELAAGPLVGHVDDAVALIDKLAASAEVQACFARNFFRFAAAESDQALENAYLESVWKQLPADRRGNVADLFVSWIASEMFVARAVAP